MPPKKLPTAIIKIIISLVAIAYPIAIFVCLQNHVSVRAMSLILLGAILVAFTKHRNKIFIIAGLALILLLLYSNELIFLKLYPCLMNIGLGTLFLSSLQKKPLAQMIVERRGCKIDERGKKYAKHVTIAWTIFLYINAVVSFGTVFLSDKLWAIYNGLISYCLIGTMLGIEYLTRRIVMQRNCNKDIFSTDENAIAFYDGDKTISFGQYKRDIAQYANSFCGIDAKTVVLYITDDVYLFCVCFMALAQSGREVILPAVLNGGTITNLGKITKTIITNTSENIDGFDKIVPTPADNDNWNFHDIDDSIVYFFTSGSTGTPKCIRKKLNMLLAEVRMHAKMQHGLLKHKPVLVASIVPYHMYGMLWRLLFPIVGGIAMDTDIVFTPEELQEKQNKYKSIVFITTPSFLDGITRYNNQYKFQDNCIGIFSSGSMLPQKTSASALDMFGVSPFEVFGSTETGGVAYRQQINGTNWTVFNPVVVHSDGDENLTIKSEFSFESPYTMSDHIQMIDATHFVLMGRTDRIVKIAEERISLPEIEARLEENPNIHRAYAAKILHNNRDVIGVMVELNDIGTDAVLRDGRTAFVANIKKYLAEFIPVVGLPRRIRIVNKIPTNPQGKFVKDEINAAFESNIVEPIMQNVNKIDSMLDADVTFLSNSDYFKGHFPEYPILPGVIQLNFVFSFIKKFFHTNVKSYTVSKLKFSSIIAPDKTVHLHIERTGENEFEFSYANGDRIYSSGKITVGGNTCLNRS